MDNEEKDIKAKQAGRDVAEVGAKAAGTYFGGAVGGKAVDIALKTKAGQSIKNNIGDKLAKTPGMRNMLAKNQETISKAKPIADSAINNGLNSKSPGLENKNKLDGKDQDLDNKKKDITNGLEDSSKIGESSSTNNTTESETFDSIFKKKKSKKLYVIIAGALMSLLAITVFFGMFFAPIMAIKEKLEGAIESIADYADAFTNLISFKGVQTSENTFWTELNNQYNTFSKQSNSQENLDISLIAATIHYEKVLDPAFFNETESIEGEEISDPSSKAGLFDTLIDKADVKMFYDWAYSELGNFNTLVLSERGLSGALVSTSVSATCEKDTFANNWENFFSTTSDFATSIANISFATKQDKIQMWNLFDFYQTNISDFKAVNYNVIDFIKQQYSQNFATIGTDAYSIAEIFKMPKITCNKETNEGKTIPTKVNYKTYLFNDYTKYEKYLKEYYLPTYYVNCSNCAYRNFSDEEKDEMIDNMIQEIYELREVYAEIIGEKTGNIYGGIYDFEGLSGSNGSFSIRNEPPYMSDCKKGNKFYYSSLNASYPNYIGQCTWYVHGRANEILNETGNTDLHFVMSGNAGQWCSSNAGLGDKAWSSSSDLNAIRLGSVIVWQNQSAGHVGIVESFNTDSAGNITNILITEGNIGGSGENTQFSTTNCGTGFRGRPINNPSGFKQTTFANLQDLASHFGYKFGCYIHILSGGSSLANYTCSSDDKLEFDAKIVVDENHLLDPSFVPKVTEVPSDYRIEDRVESLTCEALSAFISMSNACEKATGSKLKVLSGYRSYASQVTNKNQYSKNSSGYYDLKYYQTANPGASEHQTGLAVDITIGEGFICESGSSVKDGKLIVGNISCNNSEEEEVYEWLNSNAAIYGFYLSYPQNTTSPYGPEPWHWRFRAGSY